MCLFAATQNFDIQHLLFALTFLLLVTICLTRYTFNDVNKFVYNSLICSTMLKIECKFHFRLLFVGTVYTYRGRSMKYSINVTDTFCLDAVNSLDKVSQELRFIIYFDTFRFSFIHRLPTISNL